MAKAKKQAEFVQWFGPVLDALRRLGSSGSPNEVSAEIAKRLNIPDSILEQTIKSGASRFHNQVCWARQYLVWEGYLDGSVRGIWKLSPIGLKTNLSAEESRKIFLKWVDINRQKRQAKGVGKEIADAETESEIEIDDDSSITIDYRSQVLTYLREMTPANFERFCLYLLRINDFENPKLTGQSHDDGIDGSATLRVNPFVSFKVIFQAKRYKEGKNISRMQIAEFRNAMLGRADKAIFITTSKFTQEAIKEAGRDGAQPIELVDFELLIKMIEKSKMGLIEVKTYEVDHSFYKEYTGD